MNKLKAYVLQDMGQTLWKRTRCWVSRRISGTMRWALRVLVDLGLRKIRLMTNNPRSSPPWTATT